MDKKKKTECDNQWATSNMFLTSKTEVKNKDERNNEWTSTLKKSPDVYDEDNKFIKRITRVFLVILFSLNKN